MLPMIAMFWQNVDTPIWPNKFFKSHLRQCSAIKDPRVELFKGHIFRSSNPVPLTNLCYQTWIRHSYLGQDICLEFNQFAKYVLSPIRRRFILGIPRIQIKLYHLINQPILLLESTWHVRVSSLRQFRVKGLVDHVGRSKVHPRVVHPICSQCILKEKQ